MTASNPKRTTSTLSPVSNMPQGPVSAATTPKYKRTADNLAQAREKTKFDINRTLQNDRNAIAVARKSVMKSADWSMMNTKQRERMMDDAALAKIQQRKAGGIYVGSYFPVFNDYIPPHAYGRFAKGNGEKDALVRRTLDLMDDASARVRPEEGDDDEVTPSMKKLQSDNKRALRDITPYTLGQKAASTKRGKAGIVSDADNDGSATSRNSTADGNDEEVSDTDSELSELESEDEEDESKVEDEYEDEDEEEHGPLVVVSRGRPLSNDTPKPAKAYVNLKQHFATGIKSVEQAVVRGQVLCNSNHQAEAACEQTKGVASKKRAGDDGEGFGRKVKKAKAETVA